MFTRKEKQIRKQWKISLICAHSIAIIISVIDVISEGNEYFVGYAIGLILVHSLLMWRDYHCAYKKHGTKWLTWLTWIIPCALLRDVVSIDTTSWLEIIRNPLTFSYIFLCYSGCVWYWINCRKLLIINKRIQEARLSEKEGE